MVELLFLDDIDEKFLEKLNLKCGLEIHKQLNCSKLFSKAPCQIVGNLELKKKILRKLRFSKSEKGEEDVVAISEFKKNKKNFYLYNNKVSTLVDLDEEPPSNLNLEALKCAIQISQTLNLTFFDNLIFMRKLIVDGSVVSGFQRTAILGVCGFVETNFGKIKIDGVNLEEDSARRITQVGDENIFALDRYGIPLVEITTAPEIKSPIQAQEVAQILGNILKSFPQIKRGIGTIRQDLNVSINEGARVEIKGVQDLKFIPKIVEIEMKRQAILVSIKEEILKRKIDKKNFTDKKIFNLGEIFKDTKSNVICENLKNKNFEIFGIKLFNFKGILGHNLSENFRFASEILSRNKKIFTDLKGLFHLDELPNYGIENFEVEKIINFMGLKSLDSFILIVYEKQKAKQVFENIISIIEKLICGPQEEVRQVDATRNFITTYLREMPTSARMYPETDVKKIQFKKKFLEELKKNIPENYNLKILRLEKIFELEKNKIEEFLNLYDEEKIKNLCKITNKTANYLYQIIFEMQKDIKKREKINCNLKYELLEEIFKITKKNNINLKTLRDVFVSIYKDNFHEAKNLEKYLKEKNFLIEKISEIEIEKKVCEIIEKNKGAPFSALMGLCMKEFGGRVCGKKLSEILKEKI